MVGDGVRAAEQMAQAVQVHGEGSQRGIAVEIGPEGVGDLEFRHFASSVGREILQQRERALGPLAPESQRPVPDADLETAEHEDAHVLGTAILAGGVGRASEAFDEPSDVASLDSQSPGFGVDSRDRARIPARQGLAVLVPGSGERAPQGFVHARVLRGSVASGDCAGRVAPQGGLDRRNALSRLPARVARPCGVAQSRFERRVELLERLERPGMVTGSRITRGEDLDDARQERHVQLSKRDHFALRRFQPRDGLGKVVGAGRDQSGDPGEVGALVGIAGRGSALPRPGKPASFRRPRRRDGSAPPPS